MLLSAVSALVVAQSSSEIPEGLMNNTVFQIPDGNGAQPSSSSMVLGTLSLVLNQSAREVDNLAPSTAEA